MLSYPKVYQPTYIVYRHKWGEHDWDSCQVGTEKECGDAHEAELVSIHRTKAEALRAVKILNGWD